MIFAGGEPRVRTEGFDICVANGNLPQRSPNMKKDPAGRFFMFDYFFEGGEPLGSVFQGEIWLDTFSSCSLRLFISLLAFPSFRAAVLRTHHVFLSG